MTCRSKPVVTKLQASAMACIVQEMLRRGAKASDFKWLNASKNHLAQLFIEEISRKILIETTFRAQKEYKVRVNYGEDLVALASRAKIDIPFLDLADPIFKTRRRGRKLITMTLYCGFHGTTKQAVEFFKRQNKRPATLHEVLSMIVQYPLLAERLSLIALGSPFQEKKPFRPKEVAYPYVFTDHGDVDIARLLNKRTKKIRKLSYWTDHPNMYQWDDWQILVIVKE